jgi:hypothetical protein
LRRFGLAGACAVAHAHTVAYPFAFAFSVAFAFAFAFSVALAFPIAGCLRHSRRQAFAHRRRQHGWRQ